MPASKSGKGLRVATMKLLPLHVKRKISSRMHLPGFLTAMLLSVGAFIGGLGGLFVYQEHGGPHKGQEKAVMQEKITHLLTTYKTSESMHLLVTGQAKGQDFALVLPKAQEKDKSLRAVFETEAQATGIALAHSRELSPNDRYLLHKQLTVISPLPDYFKNANADDATFLLYSFRQSRVMNRPGFTPTVETAREIVSGPDRGGLVTVGFIFSPLLLTLGGMFGYCALRKRLDKSIQNEDIALSLAKEVAEREEIARKEMEAERAAAEAAERERIAKLPVTTVLENDISVRQIKLAARQPQAGA